MKRASAEVGTTTVLEKKEIKKPGIGLVNKVTPYRDLSWYIKWAGPVFLLSARDWTLVSRGSAVVR